MNVAIHEAQFALWSGFALSAVLSLLSAVLLLWLARSVLHGQRSFAWPTPACLLARIDVDPGPEGGPQPLRCLVLQSPTPSRAPPLGCGNGHRSVAALLRPDPDARLSPAPVSSA